MNNEDDVIEIDLLHILELLISKLWMIVLSALIFAGALFSYAHFMITPKYQSSAMFYVNNNNLNIGSSSFSISSSDISASQSLVDTYIVILKTRNTLNSVIKKANLDYSYTELNNMVSASAVNSTEVFKVTVTSTDPKEASDIANTIAEVLPDKISEIVTGSGAKVVDYAVVEPNKVSPSITKYTAIGGLAGAFLACLIIVLKDFFDDVIRDDSYLSNTYDDVPILAIIPNLGNKNDTSYYYKKNGYYKYGKYSRYEKYGGYEKADDTSDKKTK